MSNIQDVRILIGLQAYTVKGSGSLCVAALQSAYASSRLPGIGTARALGSRRLLSATVPSKLCSCARAHKS